METAKGIEVAAKICFCHFALTTEATRGSPRKADGNVSKGGALV